MRYRALGFIAALIAAAPAYASNKSGFVTNIYFEGNRFLVYLDGTRQGASCNSVGAGERYEINASTSLAQIQISMVLTAYTARQKITISGTNGCAIDTEAVGYISLP